MPDHLRQIRWSGHLLGFAAGGFFDGILLHQILQWHHLLSGVDAARGDITLLILADGVFHLLMYGVAAIGLWLLWLGRRGLIEGNDDLVARALLGFGSWHLVDAVLSHWIFGIHRIRMDAENPLLWDLSWLAAFGIVPLLVGWFLRGKRRSLAGGPLLTSPIALVLAVLALGTFASRPPPGGGPVMVLFHPGVPAQDAFAATQAAGARIIWADSDQRLWALDMPADANAAQFYAYGAILVSNSVLPPSCFDWLRPS